MRIFSSTLITLSILAFHGKSYSQIQNNNDTASRVIICESTLNYPTEAREKNISGTVIVAFDIDSNCRVTNVRIEKSIGYGCDEEAIKTLSKCKPRFIGVRKKCVPTFNLRQPFTFKGTDDD